MKDAYPQNIIESLPQDEIVGNLVNELIEPSQDQSGIELYINKYLEDIKSSTNDNIPLLGVLILSKFSNFLSKEQREAIQEMLRESFEESSYLVLYSFYCDEFEKALREFIYSQKSQENRTFTTDSLPKNSLIQLLLYIHFTDTVKNHQSVSIQNMYTQNNKVGVILVRQEQESQIPLQ